MSEAALITLADEVAKDLTTKSGAWALSFEAKRRYHTREELEATGNLVVTVATTGWQAERVDRLYWKHVFDLDVFLQLRPKPEEGALAHAKFDKCMKLSEEISDHYAARVNAGFRVDDCVLMGVAYGGATGLPYSVPHMVNLTQFTGVVRLTFWKYRTPA